MKSVLKYLSFITVEPIGFLMFSGLVLYGISQSALLYNVVCEQKYHNDVAVNCQTSTTLKETRYAEIYSQKEAAKWTTFFTMTQLAPVLVSDILFGAWGDRIGRKLNMFLGISGLLLMMCANAYLAFDVMTPLYLLLPFFFLAGCTGFIALVPVSCYSYLIDITVDKQEYATRMIIFAAVSSSSGIIGSLLAAILLSNFSLEWVLFMGECLAATAFVYTAFRIRQVPPEIMKRQCAEEYMKEKALRREVSAVSFEDLLKDDEARKAARVNLEVNIFVAIFRLVKESIHTFIRPREGRKRTYLILSASLYLVIMMVEIAQPIRLYVFGSPFLWQPYFLAIYTAINSSLSVIGQILGLIVLKKLLKLHETTMCLLSIFSFIAHVVVMALAKNTMMIFLASVVGMFSSLILPTIKAFVAQIVSPHELGKSFTMFGISTDIAFILGGTIFNAVYYCTVAWFPGFTFLVLGAIGAICFVAFLWMNISVRRELKLERNSALGIN